MFGHRYFSHRDALTSRRDPLTDRVAIHPTRVVSLGPVLVVQFSSNVVRLRGLWVVWLSLDTTNTYD